MTHLRRRALLLLTPFLAACGSGAVRGPYVWASGLAPEPADAAYLIRAGDDVAVSVWGNSELSVRAKVRSDGSLSMPLLGDVPAAGQSAASFAAAVERALTTGKFVNAPRVTVQVEEQLTVSVLGKVVRAGTYPLPTGRGVADALAAAGGLTDFAHKDRIYVLRRAPQLQQIRFKFGSLFDATDASSRFRLRSGDVVLVD